MNADIPTLIAIWPDQKEIKQPMTREQFDQLKTDIAELSNIVAEIGDLESFVQQQTRAEEALAARLSG